MDAGTVEATLKLRDEMGPALTRARDAVGRFKKDIDGMAGGGNGFATMIKDADKLAGSLRSTGIALTVGVGAPLAATVKIASDFESAFAGVVKTVEGFDVDAFGKLNPPAKEFREEIRALAREIPVTADELAKIAAVGGQFGVAKNELAKFTKVVAMLSVAVDGISGEQAAASLQQIRNIVGPTRVDFERLASTLVDLGNKGTSTEGTILETARRFSSAGASAKVSAADIMGLSAAVANLGFEAEVGGTVLSKTFLEITRSAQTGSAELAGFAKLAGMSAEQFKQAWGNDAVGTFQRVIGGMSDMQKAAGPLAATMEELFGKDIRQNQILMALALNTNNLSKALNDANSAYENNSALADEARKKFATFENQLKLLKGQVYDVAIELGGPMIEALRGVMTAATPLISGAGELARLFTALPGPVRTAAVALGIGAGLTGVLMVLTSKAIETGKGIADLVRLIRGLAAAQGAAAGVTALSTSVGTLATGLGRVSAVLLSAGGIMTLVAGGAGFIAASKGIDEYGKKLQSVGDKAEIVQVAATMTKGAITEFGAAWKYVNGELEKAQLIHGKLSEGQQRMRALLDATNPTLKDHAVSTDQMKDSLGGLANEYPKINLAVGAAASIQRDYVKEMAALKTQAESIPASVRAQILAFMEAGNSASDAAKEFGVAEAVIKLVGSSNKEAAKGALEHADALEKMALAAAKASEGARLGLIGFDDIEAAAQMAAAVNDLPPGFKLTKVEAEKANAVIAKGMTAIRKLILPIPKDMEKASIAVGGLGIEVGKLADEYEAASLAAMKIPKDDFTQTVESIRLAGEQTRIWAEWTDKLVAHLAGLTAPGAGDFFKNAAAMEPPKGWTKIGKNVGDVFASIPAIMQSAFEGGGGIEGALKSFGVAMSKAIMEPLLEKVKEMGKAVSGAISAGVAGASLIGGAAGGSTGALIASTASTIGGAALATTALGVAAKTSITAMVGLSAATLGIGAAAVGVYLLYKHFFTVSKEVKEARKQVQSFQEELWKTATAQQQVEAAGRGWAATLIVTRDAYVRMGRTAAEAERDVAALLDTSNPEKAREAMQKINEVVGTFRALLKASNDQMTPLLDKSGELGRRLPEDLLLAIQQLRVMGDLTEENVALFDKLAGAQDVDFKKFEEAAARYNINPDALGIAFKQSKADSTAQQMIDDFDLLMNGGASVGTILHGMREEISALVSDSRKFGTTIPENMKPWIDELLRTGQLVDENGKALTDLTGVKFGDELKTSFEKITDSLRELVDTLKGPFLDAIKNIPKNVDVDINARLTGGDGDHTTSPVPLAKGGILNRPTFVAGEAGSEIVSPLADYNRTMLAAVAAGARSAGSRSSSTRQLVQLVLADGGRPLAEALVELLPDARESIGVDR